MQYDFDEIIDRKNTNAMNTEGFREYIFHAPADMVFPYADDEFIRMWVADMEFATPPEIIQAIKERLDKRIFGYTKVFLDQHLPKAVFRIPEATYLAWVNISGYLPQEENLSLYFANNAGVLLEGGNMFVANSDGYIRLNVACPRSRLEEGLKRICDSLNSVVKTS